MLISGFMISPLKAFGEAISILIPFIGFHHVLVVFNVVSIILWSILLAGCTLGNGLKNVYLLSLAYDSEPHSQVAESLLSNPQLIKLLSGQVQDSNDTIREIRVGYVSLCAVSSSGGSFCGDSTEGLVRQVRSSGSSDPLNLLELAHSVRTEVVFYPLLIIAMISLALSTYLLLTLPGWHEVDDSYSQVSEQELAEKKPFPSDKKQHSIFGLLTVASCLGFATVFWQHISSAGSAAIIENMSYNMVKAHVGTLAMALGWVGVFFTLLSLVGVVLMILSIRVMKQLAD
ncbi:hypothetical protein PG987_005258 [Apiospora arundinis]